jgi:hypothetical protein
MGDPFRKVVRGDPLEITADAWNALMELARSHRRGVPPPGPGRRPQVIGTMDVLVQNISGADRGQFAVLAAGDPLIEPGDGLLDRIALKAGLCGYTAAAQHVVVLQEPIASGAIGRGRMVGVTLCRVNVEREDQAFARPISGDATAMVTSDWGPHVIIWKESGTGTNKWAVLSLGENRSYAKCWAKAKVGWDHGGDKLLATTINAGVGGTVVAYPCQDESGHGTDDQTELVVILKACPSREWSITTGKVFHYLEMPVNSDEAEPRLLCDDYRYLDETVGTIKLWPNSGVGGGAWLLCNGQNDAHGHAVPNLSNRFPRATGAGIGDVKSGDTGGAETHVHPDHVFTPTLHTEYVVQPGGSYGPTSVDEVTISHAAANHMPPWTGVGFYVRADDSKVAT